MRQEAQNNGSTCDTRACVGHPFPASCTLLRGALLLPPALRDSAYMARRAPACHPACSPASRSACACAPSACLQVLDVLIRFIAASSPTAVAYGRSVFFNNPNTKIPLPGGTEAWSGFTQVRAGGCTQLLCVGRQLARDARRRLTLPRVYVHVCVSTDSSFKIAALTARTLRCRLVSALYVHRQISVCSKGLLALMQSV